MSDEIVSLLWQIYPIFSFPVIQSVNLTLFDPSNKMPFSIVGQKDTVLVRVFGLTHGMLSPSFLFQDNFLVTLLPPR